VKAITAANAQAAYSTSRASAQAAHDAAMLDAIEDWQQTANISRDWASRTPLLESLAALAGDYVDQTFNFLYGVGDNMSLGIGWWLRSTFFDDQADYGGSSYYIGSWVGFVADLAIGGAFKSIGRVFGKELLEQGTRIAANSAGRQKWFNFLADQGGETVATGYGAAYVGNLAWANRLGLRQGYSTTIRNFDSAGSWFARTDTAVHEGFHALVGKHLPSVWKAGDATLFKIPVGAPIKYVEEVFAYADGHGGALRLHGIPFAPIEAFGSLTAGESVTTIIFGIGVYSIYEYFNG
jgi:hypothetical protein